jgi:hypothetical protein
MTILRASEAKKLSKEYNDSKNIVFSKIRDAAEKGETYVNVDSLSEKMKILLEEIGYVVSNNYEEDCYTIEW